VSILGPLLLLICVAGFASLALGMEKHWKQVWNSELGARRRRALRFSGWVLLAAALAVAVIGWGVSIGIVVWVGSLTGAGLAVVLALAKVEQRLGARATPGSKNGN